MSPNQPTPFISSILAGFPSPLVREGQGEEGCRVRTRKNPITNFALALLLLTLALPLTAAAETLVSGQINIDTTWTKAGSPYIVNGDLIVGAASSKAVTLTIEPGVIIRFHPWARLLLGTCWDDDDGERHGRLQAIGSASEPIVFTSNSPNPAPGDWGGISFESCVAGDPSVLEHCIVEYGGSSNLEFYSEPAAIINNCIIRRCAGAGISIGSWAEGMTIGGDGAGNLISENATDGIVCYQRDAVIVGNTFSGNGFYPLGVSPAATVRNNTFTANGNQAILILGYGIDRNMLWENQGVPFVIADDLYVGRKDNPAVLSLEAGVELRFQTGSKLQIGWSEYGVDYLGGLVAQGTDARPVVFTSDAATPKPGDWLGILFGNVAVNSLSILERCQVEYARTGIAAEDASIRLHYSTVRRSLENGVYLLGAGSTGSVIQCNSIQENNYGVRIGDGASALIRLNNFSGNSKAGIFYNHDSGPLNAVDNWWGDAAGPNTGGDKVLGSVNFTPWLASPSACSGYQPTQLPPFVPYQPDPADDAPRVPLIAENKPIPVKLGWAGGDPNPGDTAVYDVYLGTSPENMIRIAEGLNAPVFSRNGLEASTKYFWQVAARDPSGAETTGPVWKFTTMSSVLPDLTVKSVTWEPAGNLYAGQPVLITFVIENIGTGPALPFTLVYGISRPQDDWINVGSSIPAGGSIEVKSTWYAYAGSHSMVVLLDYYSEVYESSEVNNTFTTVFPPVADTAAPQLGSTRPYNGEIVKTADPISFYLYDRYGGQVDDAAVIASVRVTNSKGELIAGNVSEDYSNFIFTPAVRPLPDETYKVSLTARDIAGNAADYSFTFTVDTVPPPPLQVVPLPPTVHDPNLQVKGTKESYAAIVLGEQTKVYHTAGTLWEFTVTLTKGLNTLVLKARDRAGNFSIPTTVEIIYDDSPPPAVDTLSVDPKGNGTYAKLSWAGYDEAGFGAVAYYNVYAGLEPFSDVATRPRVFYVSPGYFSCTVSGLQRGKTYWFAVVAVGQNGKFNPAVNPVSAKLVDIIPPNNVTGLSAQSSSDRLVFTWNPPSNPENDLDSYRVFFDGDAAGENLPASQTSYTKPGLSPATKYVFRVASVDKDVNQSSGTAITAITLMPTPSGLKAEPFLGYVNLSWDHVEPAELRHSYRVYVNTADFTSVAGMTPAKTLIGNTASVTGLANGTTYYFAVTTIDISGGENQAVATVSATPTADTEGPVITDVYVNEVPLVSGYLLRTPATFTCLAQDPAGVGRVEFSIDGTLIASDPSAIYSAYWDIFSAADGGHTLTIAAYDTLGNRSTLDFTLVVALEVPPAPVITQPPTGLLTNKAVQSVSGYSAPFTTVSLFLNGVKAAGPLAVDSAGKFSTVLTLKEGPNLIAAAAQNRAGTSPLSEEVLVTLDSSLPQAPLGLSASGRPGGAIQLGWQAPADKSVSGYLLYRAEHPFGAVGQAGRVNLHPIAGLGFSDLPPADGTWFYRVTAIDPAGNESEPSNEAKAVSDRTAPRAAAIAFTPQGPFDAATGAIAPGTVQVVLTVSEPLQAAPYLAIVPEGGSPIGVALIQENETRFKGFFVIAPDTPSGTAYAIFSARDLIGNRGTEIDLGAAILIDTAGPAVSRLDLTPADPIKNDEKAPVTVSVNLGLTEAPAPGSVPKLSYVLSGPGREPVAIGPLAELPAAPGDGATFKTEFMLPASAGLGAPESLRFLFSAVDKLQNPGERIQVKNLFQVYQGNLPPLAAPEELSAIALPGGKIRLSWKPVANAAGYELFRKAPGESALGAYARPGSVLEFTDQPSADGLYTYAIASIRRENGQEAVSGQSAPVTAGSDSVPPAAPLNFTLTLAANGIAAAWQPPPITEPVTYALYRADSQEITSVEGLTALARGIAQTLAVDTAPSPSAHCYAVTAVDAAGNESPPSNSVYLNFQLLPVSGITVTQSGTDPPAVAWTHPGGDIAGYDAYLGGKTGGIKLNAGVLKEKSFVDAGFAGDERIYTIVAVDEDGVESLPRRITLPKLRAKLKEASRLYRGVMNRLEFAVENQGETPVEDLRLKVNVAGRPHVSEPVSLAAGSTLVIPVVVGGYAELADENELATAVEIKPAANDQVRILSTASIPAEDGALILQIQPEEFTRAASGRARFTLENTGAAEIEIVTAAGGGAADSPEIAFSLLDADGNVLAVKPFKQVIGESLITLPNGNTVARIGAGRIFTSEAISIPVPASAPEGAVLRLEISKVYYRQGKPEEAVMAGPATTQAVTLAETSYYGEVTAISPKTSTGEAEIAIAGRAIERTSGQALANVPLKLVITLSGFERTFTVTTGANGAFTQRFTPPAGESGVYSVRAVHPDVTDKPVHGTFTVSRVGVTPAEINLSLPKNYEKTIALQATAGEGTAVRNLRLIYAAADQPGGEFPPGVHFTPGEPVAVVSEREAAALPFTIWADNTAPLAVILKLRVVSDESPPAGWATVTLQAAFSEARPVVTFSPDHVETGVTRNGTAGETLSIKNSGLAELNGLALTITDEAGRPAPGWVSLAGVLDQPVLKVGESVEVRVNFAPGAAVAEGDYAFKLKISAANHPPVEVNLFVAVTQQGFGNALLKVADIYTGTLGRDGKLIQGLSGVRVELQNELVLSELFTLETDEAGEAYFLSLAAGQYKCRVSANNHQEFIGRLRVKPGITVTQEVFLDYNLVTVEWRVTEIVIQDKYEIVLTAVYETNVPAAVVVAEPASLALPAMKPGDVLNGEFTLTNYGLIRADNLVLTLPRNDPYYRYETLGALPASLSAKGRITVPYRVVCLKSPEGDGTGSGGGCQSYSACARIDYGYTCANGADTRGSARHCWTYTYGSCGGTPPVIGPGGGGSWGVGGGGGGGTSSPAAPAPRPITGVKCFPSPIRKEAYCGDDCALSKETRQGILQDVASQVNLVLGEYTREHADLTVKVPGGVIAAGRRYYANAWHFEHTRHNLVLKPGVIGSGIESIEKAGVIYRASALDSDLFVHDTYRIRTSASGFRWEDKSGGFKDFDAEGRMLSYGGRNGVVGRLNYAGGRLAGVSDRNNQPVLWYEWAGERIASMRDKANRRVDYDWSNGRLSSVTDPTGAVTRFEYDGKGRVSKALDAEGREVAIGYDDYGRAASVLNALGKGHRFEYDYDESRQELYARMQTAAGLLKEIWFDKHDEIKRVDLNGRTVMKIQKDGRHLIITDERGETTRKEYDERDNLTRVIHPDGAIESYEYERGFNRRTREVNALGIATAYDYDAAGNLIGKTEVPGHLDARVSEYGYDGLGNLVFTRRLGDGTAPEAVTTMAYDIDGNLAVITDPEGGVSRLSEHDLMGNVLKKIDPRGMLWTYTYDAAGRLLSASNPLGNTSSVAYDKTGRKIFETDAEGRRKALCL